jgi:adenylate kinase
MRIALLGPPGAGKGTQGLRICQKFGLRHLASGDILRSEKNAGTVAGCKIREFIDAGLLVPDELMLAVMQDKILALDRGFVLDGFPRTLPQAQALDQLLRDRNRPLNLVLNFVVNPQALYQRFAGRRICPQCFTVYHIDSAPPRVAGVCDNDGVNLITREDDRLDVVEQRILTYTQTMAPLIAYYAQRGNLETIDASGSIDDVTTLVFDKIRRVDQKEPPA